MSQLLTNTRLRTHRRCQRMHHIQYVLGYRPVREDAELAFGTLVHLGLEAWWTAKQNGAEALLPALAIILASNADPFDIVRAEVMLTGYDARWGDAEMEVLGVEVPFETQLVTEDRLGGKMDAIARIDGKVFIVEHKTSSSDISAGSDYWRRLRLDSQISIYHEGARSLGHDVAGCLYDVLGKPGQRPLKVNSRRTADETADEYKVRIVEAMLKEPHAYYQRQTIVRLESELRESMLDVTEQAKQIFSSSSAPKNPDACFQFGKPCPFFGVCCGEQSLDSPEHFKKLNNVHPELAQ